MQSFYGLRVDSELELPGLAASDGEAELVIRCGPVPAQFDAPTVRGVCFQAAPGRFLLELHNVARYLVIEGREVIIDRVAGAEDEEIRTFLLGTVLGAVLYQRGMVPFHASAVRTAQGAVLFGGRSGMGKSTLAAALARRGHPVLADDVAAVTTAPDGAPVLVPGSSELRLWSDSLSRLGIPTEALHRVRPELQKHIWRPDACQAAGPVPMIAYYHLERHNEPAVVLTPVQGMERIRVLRTEIYRAALSRSLANPATVFSVTTALGRTAHVVRIRRPNHPYLLDQLVDNVLADLDGIPGGSLGTAA
jgi:hypothetical protein